MIFHVLALAPAAVGLCCLAADRRRARLAELGAGLLMMIAMLDAAVTGLVPVVWWVVALVGGAMALAVVRGRARGGVHPATGSGAGDEVGVAGAGGAAGGMVSERIMAVHSAAGMVVMAGLLLTMAGMSGLASSGHHHAATPSLAVSAGVLAAGYLVASAILAARARSRLDRGQYVAMAASVGLMSLALVG